MDGQEAQKGPYPSTYMQNFPQHQQQQQGYMPYQSYGAPNQPNYGQSHSSQFSNMNHSGYPNYYQSGNYMQMGNYPSNTHYIPTTPTGNYSNSASVVPSASVSTPTGNYSNTASVVPSVSVSTPTGNYSNTASVVPSVSASTPAFEEKTVEKEAITQPVTESKLSVTTNNAFTQGQKREREPKSDDDFVPKKFRHGEEEDSTGRDEQSRSPESEKKSEEEVEPESTGPEIEVSWPEDAHIKKDDAEENTELKQYEKVICGGVSYSIGDNIAFWPESKGKNAPMGTIKSLYTDGENNLLQCCWWYRVEETILKNNRRSASKVGKEEVFLSTHVDENVVESIHKKVTIKKASEIGDTNAISDYIKTPDCYYYKRQYNHFDKCFVDL